MIDPTMLDRTFQIILKHMIETGQAPHYTDIASDLELPMEEGRKILHKLFESGIPGWLFPNTSLIASFAPFNNLPTQYRITIDDHQKWFAQWGLEALAVCWLFPGKTVRVECPCLDCGLPISIEIRDGNLLHVEPEGVTAYVAIPFWKWFDDLPYAWSRMNLFRSEEHVRGWAQFDTETDEGIIPLNEAFKIVSSSYFRKRLEPDWVSRSREYAMEMLATLNELGRTGPFWRRPKQ
jgi:hypothetical protein